MLLPSGDQNGKRASSVPVSFLDTPESNECTQRAEPLAFVVNAMARPSGDSAIEREKPSPGGARTENRVGVRRTDGRRTFIAADATRATASAAAIPQAIRSRLLRCEATLTGTPACDPSAIHS